MECHADAQCRVVLQVESDLHARRVEDFPPHQGATRRDDHLEGWQRQDRTKGLSPKGIIIDAQRGSIDIGRNVSLNDYAILLGRGGITIGNDVRIAGNAMVVSFDHNFDDPTQPIRMQGVTKKPIVIEDDVWIGAGARFWAVPIYPKDASSARMPSSRGGPNPMASMSALPRG